MSDSSNKNKRLYILYAIGGIVGIVALIAPWSLRFQGDAQIGQRLVENNCDICHDLSSTEKNERGPHLWGVYGRYAGIITDFHYSKGFLSRMEQDRFVWDDAHLHLFLEDPTQFIPNNSMSKKKGKHHPRKFDNINSYENRSDVIAYLKTLR